MSKVKSKWISGKELLERWNISDFDLLEYRQKGLLIPYTKGFSQYMGQNIDITPLLDSLPQLPPGVSLPPGAADAIGENFGEKIRDEIRNKLLQCLYKLEDVQKFEQEYGYNQSTISGKVEKNILQCDLGTKWEDIKITLMAEDMVKIKTPKGEDRFTYHQLKMQDRRIGDQPTMVWGFLKILAKTHGFLSGLPRPS